MISVPLRRVPTKVVDVVVAARDGNGVHAYYSNGYDIEVTGGKVILPSWMIPDAYFTVVFQYIAAPSTAPHAILLGKFNEETKTNFALEAAQSFSSSRMDNGSVQSGNTEDVSNIPLEGFHVLQFYRSAQALEPFLDGQRCLKEGTITNSAKEYTTFAPKTTGSSAFIIWESHQVMPDPKTNLEPRITFEHQGRPISTGGYVQFHGDWTKKPKVFVNTVDVSSLSNVDLDPGEQIIVLKVYKDNYTITSSAKPKDVWVHKGDVPVHSFVDVTRDVNVFYSYTVVFTDMKVK